MAPEISSKLDYKGSPIDVWALGILTFRLLFGVFPFRASNERELFWIINKMSLKFPNTPLVSNEAKDLLTQMLKKNPIEWIKITEITNHLWFC